MKNLLRNFLLTLAFSFLLLPSVAISGPIGPSVGFSGMVNFQGGILSLEDGAINSIDGFTTPPFSSGSTVDFTAVWVDGTDWFTTGTLSVNDPSGGEIFSGVLTFDASPDDIPSGFGFALVGTIGGYSGTAPLEFMPFANYNILFFGTALDIFNSDFPSPQFITGDISQAAVPTPVPGALVLLGTGLVALTGIRRVKDRGQE